MELEKFFDKKHVIFLESNEKQMVLREMLAKLEELGKIENSNRYYTQIIHRESLENTGIGKGVAIPHTRTETVPEFISILGISKLGIDYQSFDDDTGSLCSPEYIPDKIKYTIFVSYWNDIAYLFR